MSVTVTSDPAQRTAALALANERRATNKLVKDGVAELPPAAGAALASSIIEGSEHGSVRVDQLLGSIERVGPRKVTALLCAAGIPSGAVRLDSLTSRQRAALLDALARPLRFSPAAAGGLAAAELLAVRDELSKRADLFAAPADATVAERVRALGTAAAYWRAIATCRIEAEA